MTNNQRNHCFAFEKDFIGDLRCIPLCVRRKLDLIGLKLKLYHWQSLTLEDKKKVLDWSDTTNELLNLKIFLKNKTLNSKFGEAKEIKIASNQPWQNKNVIPINVWEAAQIRGIKLSNEKWQNLSELDRFAFCKLIKPSHEHQNLDKAFSEILN